MAKKTLITAGLPYSNGDLHVGHIAGCYLPADIYNRYLKMQGKESLYVCGSDDHGVAIVISAKQKGICPEEVVAYYHERQQKAFAGLMIDFDHYGSTSKSPTHKEVSEDLFLKLHDKGYFSKETTEQFYDIESKAFLPDRYVKGTCGFCGAENQNGDQCEQCGKILDTDSLKDPQSTLSGGEVVKKPTVHWFLDLTKSEEVVAQWLDEADVRDNTKAFVKGLLGAGLVKRSMTRDISWGLPVPLDDPDAQGKVLYVWFDAPIGYISNVKDLMIENDKGPEAYKNWWNNKDTDVYHFIGEDNTVFHCIIWIAMLQAYGDYNLPKGVIVNNFMNVKVGEEVEKISKSKGNAVAILDYLELERDPEYLRYYLSMIAPEKARTNFNEAEFFQACNSDLADTLGNFINRAFAFGNKYFEGKMPSYEEILWGDLEKTLVEKTEHCHNKMTEHLNNFSTRNAMREFFEFARYCNKYFNDKAPWVSRKTDMADAGLAVAMSLNAAQSMAVFLAPFLPVKSKKILSSFGTEEVLAWSDYKSYTKSGTQVTAPGVLFPKFDIS
ncbi:MAG: methionine--tRNA ligase [Bdellovibrionaceae bacterium]|nr:methionine--tRNA ligase [Pseudobdellovibrionaceae bacterium]